MMRHSAVELPDHSPPIEDNRIGESVSPTTTNDHNSELNPIPVQTNTKRPASDPDELEAAIKKARYTKRQSNSKKLTQNVMRLNESKRDRTILAALFHDFFSSPQGGSSFDSKLSRRQCYDLMTREHGMLSIQLSHSIIQLQPNLFQVVEHKTSGEDILLGSGTSGIVKHARFQISQTSNGNIRLSQTNRAVKTIKNPVKRLSDETDRLRKLYPNETFQFIARNDPANTQHLFMPNFGIPINKLINSELMKLVDSNIFLTVCLNLFRALKQLHKAKLIHGDIKEANILINQDRCVNLADKQAYEIRLIDLGLSVANKPSTTVRESRGEPHVALHQSPFGNRYVYDPQKQRMCFR